MFQRSHLDICCQQIADKMGWGPVSEWSQREFEQLSQKIFTATGIQLSITTLKRAFGRLQYSGVPYKTTLDSLAQFNGFDNWFAFTETVKALQKAGTEEDLPEPTAEELSTLEALEDAIGITLEEDEKDLTPPQTPWLVGIILLLCMMGVAWGLGVYNKYLLALPKLYPIQVDKAWVHNAPHTIHLRFQVPEKYRHKLILIDFGAQKKTAPQLENTNILRHDANGLAKVSHTYDQPGLYRIRIFAEHELLANTAIYIGEAGWTAGIQSKSGTTDTTINNVEAINGTWSLNANQRSSHGEWNRFTYMHGQPLLDADKATIQVRFKVNSTEKQNSNVFLRIHTARGASIVQLESEKSLSTGAYNQIGEVYFSKSSDTLPAMLKQNLEGWHLLATQLKEGHADVLLDQKKVYELNYRQILGGLYGIEILSRTTIALDYVVIKDSRTQEVVYRTDCSTWPK